MLFTVRCDASLLWHPALHHSLLLLRALKQRHTLLLEPNDNPFASCRGCGQRLTISYSDTIATSSAESNASGASLNLLPLRVHDPRDILHFFPSFSFDTTLSSRAAPLLQSYMDAVLVSGELLAAADDCLAALDTTDAESVRQSHAQLMDLAARLDGSMQCDAQRPEEVLAECVLTALLRFLIAEGGLPLGPFPQLSAAFARLHGTAAVRAHDRLITQTLEGSGGLTEWPKRYFLREAQRRIAAYTTSAAEEAKGKEVGRMGLQPIPARLPWTKRGRV